MTEAQAFHIMASRLTPLECYRERSADGILRETVERCSPQVRKLAARCLERALARGGDALPRLWRGSGAALFTPPEQAPAFAKALIKALRDPTIVSHPWQEAIT